MTTHTASRTLPFGAITVHRIVTSVRDFAERAEAWSRSRRTAEELSRLSPEQLDDIGLTLADIDAYRRSGRL